MRVKLGHYVLLFILPGEFVSRTRVVLATFVHFCHIKALVITGPALFTRNNYKNEPILRELDRIR